MKQDKFTPAQNVGSKGLWCSRNFIMKHNKIGLLRLKDESKDNLEALYDACGRTSEALAVHFGVSQCAVVNRLMRLGISVRTRSEFITERNVKSFPGLTEDQEQLIYGSMLGDACLHHVKNHRY